MTAKRITTTDFDRRASAGDAMSEFFARYEACGLDLDGLIDEIWSEQQELAAGRGEGAAR